MKNQLKSLWTMAMLSLSFLAIAQIIPTDGIVYVTPNGTGNGSSWLNPTGDLHNAIHTDGVQKVFVAVGNYDVGDNSFVMKNNVAIYGGFDPASGIEDLDDNRILPNKGMGEGSVLNGQNARPVIWNDNNSLNNSALLDGFTIKNGYNSGNGGGIYCYNSAPKLINLVIKNNSANNGAGMYCFPSNVNISYSIIENNTATVRGGGIYHRGLSPSYSNIIVKGNTAAEGGGAYFQQVNSDVTNMVFTGNTATNNIGSAISSFSARSLINITVAGNNGTDAVYLSNINFTMKNSIIYGGLSGANNLNSNNCLIEGYSNEANGNIDATGITVEDIFTNPSGGDYTLKSGSPAIDAGDNASYNDLADAKDIAGNPRWSGSAVDMGAYEEFGLTPNNGTIYVREGFSGNGVSWANATSDLHNTIHTEGVQQVFVAVGNYNVGDNSFVMKNNVEIYGGFDPDNGITNLTHNRVLPNKTNLEGSVLNGQNVRPVVYNVFPWDEVLDTSAVLDGFTVMNGNGGDDGGGGINNKYASPTLRNLVIKNNTNSTSGSALGGGIKNDYSSPIITNAVIKGNTATMGGGMFNLTNCNPVLTNVLVTDNTATHSTNNFKIAGIYTYNTGVYTNVTIVGNTGKQLQANDGTAQFNNVIALGDNIFVSNNAQHSLISGNTNLTNGNLDATGVTAEAIFTNPSTGDYTLKSGSIAIDAGSNALFAEVTDAKDIAGNPRWSGLAIDMGAYEVFSLTPNNGIIYVREGSTGNGVSWNTATGDLHNAIHALGVQKVFVEKGNYNVGDHSFIMKNGVEIYGGFDVINGITDLTHNRILPNKGMGNGSVLNGQNTRPLIWNDNNGLNHTALLDGFTLMNGKSAISGGGIYNRLSAPSFNNLVIRNNESEVAGGAIFNLSAPIKMSNTIIRNNTALYGGGIRNNNSNSELTNVIISSNSATQDNGGAGGGGIFNELSDLVLTNVTITDNSTALGGGGFRNLSGNPVFTNVTVASNTAATAGTDAIEIAGGTAELKNTIVYGEISGTYDPRSSLIQNNIDDENGNLDAADFAIDGVFIKPSTGDYRLKYGSVAVNTGNNALYTGLDETTKDLIGNPRLYNPANGGLIDLGAYESAYTTLYPTNGIIYVKAGGAGVEDGSDWDNATANLHDAIHIDGVQKVFVAVGNYNVGEHSFIMKNNVEIYGGFDPENGIEDLDDERILPNKSSSEGSALDGQNARPVIWNDNNGLANTAVLDGFTIKNGYTDDRGGGIYNSNASPLLNNLVIRNNSGRQGGCGMANFSSSPIVQNTHIIDNGTYTDWSSEGGGVYNYASQATFTNVIIKGNSLQSSFNVMRGGGMYSMYNSSITLTNVLIADNSIINHGNNWAFGGGISNDGSSTYITNATIVNNSAKGSLLVKGGGVYSTGGSVVVRNSIIWGNTLESTNNAPEGVDFSAGGTLSVKNSLTQVYTGSPSDMNIIGEDPYFNDVVNGDYTLSENSPAIDTGDEIYFAGLDENTKDLAGNARVFGYNNGGAIDMGAYESSHPYITLTPDANGIIYVKETASGSKNGSDWDNATSNLRKAIGITGVEQVWVATGMYPANNIQMKNNVEIYGGFDPGNGIVDLTDNRILPNPDANVQGSTINGQTFGRIVANDNNGVNTTAVLDGFTLTGGNSSTGGGIYNNGASPTLSNLWIKGNTVSNDGAGMFNNNSASPVMTNITLSVNSARYGAGIFNRNNSSPVMTNVTIKANTSTEDGGGMYNDDAASPVMTNVSITGNTAKNGAGMYNRTNSSPVLTNVLIANNTATTNGAAIRNEAASSPTLTNVTIAGNTGSTTLYATNGSTSLSNSIVLGTVSGSYVPQYSLIEGNTDFSNGNIDATEITVSDIFTDPANGDYTLKNGVVAVDAGNNALFTALDENTLDLAGNPRVYDYANDGVIDLGAYESALASITPDADGIIYIKETQSGTGSGNSWDNATSDLHNAIHTNGVQKVFVAVGHYTTGDNSFVMKNGVEIYGGFDPENGIQDLDDTRILPSLTEEGSVLDGEDSRTVIRNEFTVDNPLNNTAVLDGFTITEGSGYAGGNYGGGIYNYYASPILTNLVIKNGIAYQGGGIYNKHSDPIVTNTIIHNNEAYSGGGVCNTESSPVFTNITISENTAAIGGAIYMDESSGEVVFTNAKITGNTGESSVIYSFSIDSESDITFINTEITDNQITQPFYSNSALVINSSNGAMLFQNMTFASNGNGTKFRTTAFNGGIFLKNSIAFGVYEEEYLFNAEYSFIEDNEDDSNGNIVLDIIYEDEIFTDPDNGDFTLKINSPVINTGNNALYPGLDENTLDLAGNQRLFGENIDLGAYESTFVPASEHCLYATTWNGTSWSNGVPDYDTQAIIDGDLVIDYELDACEVVVTPNGSLRILADAILDCDWSVTNLATADDFVIENNGNLIQWEEVENTGAITVKRESQPMIRLDYTLWSSPVVGQNLFNFSPETVNGVTNYPGSTGRIYVYDGANGYVNPNPFLADTEMNSGMGYLFRSPNNFDSTVPAVYEGIFTGVPFNGDLSVPTVANNYTSIGNPYPSNIEAYYFIYTNPEVSTLYFWNNNHDAGNNYATCTLGNCVAASGGGNLPNGIISAGQGFIVATSGTSVNFNNLMRTDDTAVFSKTDETEKHRFWLNLNDDESNGYNQILVSYMDEATNGIDNRIDAPLFGYEGSALYNLIDNDSFVIQGRALPFEASDVVPLGFRAAQQGKFIISLDNFDGLFAEGNVTVYLKDKQMNIIHNLMESDYDFESTAGEFNDRFEIVYGGDGTMGINDLASGEIQIYKDNDFIVVESKSEKILSVELFDLSGRNIYRNDNVNSNLYKVKSAAKGILVVRAQTQNGKVETKKVINR